MVTTSVCKKSTGYSNFVCRKNVYSSYSRGMWAYDGNQTARKTEVHNGLERHRWLECWKCAINWNRGRQNSNNSPLLCPASRTDRVESWSLICSHCPTVAESSENNFKRLASVLEKISSDGLRFARFLREMYFACRLFDNRGPKQRQYLLFLRLAESRNAASWFNIESRWEWAEDHETKKNTQRNWRQWVPRHFRASAILPRAVAKIKIIAHGWRTAFNARRQRRRSPRFCTAGLFSITITEDTRPKGRWFCSKTLVIFLNSVVES